ncbi:MAG TPA: hypothetical protein VFN57_06730 [Thermomicrobiaceae bacterium]|nr:hypothetical protein [Thermomicrobiaceae bacterium]
MLHLRLALLSALVVALAALGGAAPAGAAGSPPDQVYFPQTGHAVGSDFLDEWLQGGLPIFGYPLTDAFQQNGMTVQYFERAVFEYHPANPPGWTVELRRLGALATAGRTGEQPFQPLPSTTGSDANCTFYPQTGHRLCFGFQDYWQSHGGLAVFGYPLSEEFPEKNPDTGQTYTVQYFERARFEYHPNNPPGWQVELGRLGAAAAAADGVDTAPSPQPAGVPTYDPALWAGANGISVQLPVIFHAQQDPNWCDPADLETWLQLDGAPLPSGDDHAIQASLWSYEISHNDGFNLAQWSASPYAVAATFDHVSGRTDVGDAAYTDPTQAGIRISQSIAVLHEPVIALVDNGTHYILVTGVTLGPGGAAAPPASVTIYDPWTLAPTRDGFPAMGQGTTWNWATFLTRFNPDATTDPGIWSGHWVLVATGLPLAG